jgi:hypothetical protein
VPGKQEFQPAIQELIGIFHAAGRPTLSAIKAWVQGKEVREAGDVLVCRIACMMCEVGCVASLTFE